MASLKQVDANRRNALNSTGPKTEAGKQRSSANAVRHGLTAETVIDVLEDPEDYKAFEASVTADFDVQTAVERELVLRLASLLWRLRRATAIETGLLQIQSEILREARQAQQSRLLPLERRLNGMMRCKESTPDFESFGARGDGKGDLEGAKTANDPRVSGSIRQPAHRIISEIARCFLRLANVDNGAFERVGRYETALWRQVGQILLTLDLLRRQNLNGVGHSKLTDCRSRYFR
jgi:hypothetical protein